MNVDLSSWNFVLLTILKRISSAYAISIDLELSGIPVRARRNGNGRQTLQERYDELREAAKKFSILQVGLTLVEEDVEREAYVLRTYNFNISPLIADNLGLEREFTYSSGAVNFLLGTGYRMEAPFSWGIPYLTKAETAEAREAHRRRHDRTSIPALHIRDDDHEALGFVKRVKEEINEWKRTKKPDKDAIVITGTPFSAIHSDINPAALNAFQRRLVHQVVRSEFTDLSTYGRKDCVFVHYKDEKEEIGIAEKNEKSLRADLHTQLGFRFITDALAGADFVDAIDPDIIGRRIEGEPQSPSTKAFKRRLGELDQSLKEHQTILIGHNCFLDFVYIYQTFYGDLPRTVEEFQEALHKLFPLIIDTKFMATSPPTDKNRGLQLFQINDMLEGQPDPKIVNSDDHPAYLDMEEKLHEAGYDSYITAKTFLRLASGLEAKGEYANNGEQSTTEEHDQPVQLSAGEIARDSQNLDKKKSKRKVKSDKDSKFSHSNAYDTLRELEDEPVPISAETPASTSNAVGASQPDVVPLNDQLKFLHIGASDERRNNRKLLPPWDTNFWKVYGNKLRVFGTMEEVCDLTQGPKRKDTEVDDEAIAEDALEDNGGIRTARGRTTSWTESIVSYFRGGD